MPRVIADGCVHVVCQDYEADSMYERSAVIRVELHEHHATMCVKRMGASGWEAVRTVRGDTMEALRSALSAESPVFEAIMAAPAD